MPSAATSAHTAEQYAVEAFERYGADALTVSPFMGFDSIEPYLAWPGKGVILLCRTSNPGGGDFQLLESGGERLFERIARLAGDRVEPRRRTRAGRGRDLSARSCAGSGSWRRRCRCWCRASARRAATSKPPCRPASTTEAAGLVINSSRAILYAGHDRDFAAAARAASLQARDAIRRAVAAMAAARLRPIDGCRARRPEV